MDVDGDPLTLVESSFSEPVNGTITVDNLTGDLIYTPDPNSSHTETLTYLVSDGMTETESTLEITVAAVNDATMTRADSLSTAEDTALNLTDEFSFLLSNDMDIDGDPVSYTHLTLPTIYSV